MVNKKGLGRGIEALFSDNNVQPEETINDVKLTELVPNPYQPRARFDKAALDELATSIKKSGVFQPIIIRKSAHQGQYEILAGERRFRASEIAGKDTIPAIVRDVSDEEMMEIAILENLQREDLTAIEEAEAYNTLMVNLNLTQAQVASRMGKSRSYVANYLRLLGLPNEVKEMVQKKQLSMGQARALLSVTDKNELRKLAKRVYDQTMTVRQINKEIEAMNDQKPVKKAKRTARNKSPFLRATEDKLQDRFGTAVSINGNRSKRGHGKIEIDYMSNDDLNRILKILNINID
ncbi:ParB/RepB/Spo0J family partition protein [Nicoliella spurrieriana]|uniref:ParB/RepB/Spo0J family partition protein n=1 Tax=Nicoliella spurrieriana TaxID=2925830 RepID=A0A976RSR2_9LACO|nr:ParB/RepB/Spo0J family partition protein [Nicoliella spurrieriana]UQS87099.1 ParB/RepB/Spo0J family partition protein [Nicoliella spurrieriana]